MIVQNMEFNNRIHFQTINSTNTYLKEHYHKLEHGTIITAKNQINGRGRMDRVWVNDDDILMSILIKKGLKLEESSKVSLVAAASVFYTLSKYVDNVKIKWPNDVLVNDRKICGILIESVIINKELQCLIVGIGVNVNTVDFPEDLKTKATSLTLETTNTYNVESLTNELINDFNYIYQQFKNNNKEYLNIYKRHSCLIGKNVIIDDYETKEKGKVLDILDNGNILIDFGYYIRQYNSGEVTIVKY